MGGWVNGRREGVGELIFSNYKYKGNFSADQVTITYITAIYMYTSLIPRLSHKLYVCRQAGTRLIYT